MPNTCSYLRDRGGSKLKNMKQDNASAVGQAAKAADGRRQSYILESKKGCSTEVEKHLSLSVYDYSSDFGEHQEMFGESRTRNNLTDVVYKGRPLFQKPEQHKL